MKTIISMGGLERGGFKRLGKKKMKTDTRVGGSEQPSASSQGHQHVSYSLRERNKKVREEKDTSQNPRTIYYQAKEQKRS